MYKIFVSYSKEDLPLIRNLTEIIKYPGVDIFVAEDKVKAGDPLWPTILTNIDQAQIVLVFISRHSLISANVNNEIGYALKADKNIVPIIIEEGIKPPSVLAYLKYINFISDQNKSVLELQEIIKQALAAERVNLEKVEQQKGQIENVQSLIIVVVLIIVIVWALRNKK